MEIQGHIITARFSINLCYQSKSILHTNAHSCKFFFVKCLMDNAPLGIIAPIHDLGDNDVNKPTET